MVAKWIVFMHIIAELTAYWLACFTCICSNREFICSGVLIYNVASIFGQAYVINVKCMYTSACGDIY